MSLKPEPIGEIPQETIRVAKAAFPKGNLTSKISKQKRIGRKSRGKECLDTRK